MPQELLTAERGERKRPLGCLVVVVTFLIASTLIVAPFVSYHRAMTGFLAQHAEVDPLIESIYLHYFESGKWPETLQALERPDMSDAPDGWRYYFQSEDRADPPMLDKLGPLHMRLTYTFRKNGLMQSPGGWSATCEGDPWRHDFQERIPSRAIGKAN